MDLVLLLAFIFGALIAALFLFYFCCNSICGSGQTTEHPNESISSGHREPLSRTTFSVDNEWSGRFPRTFLPSISAETQSYQSLMGELQKCLCDMHPPNPNVVPSMEEVEKMQRITGRAQDLILSTGHYSYPDCRLIIGVDATPAIQAGYLVNVLEKRLYYYVLKRNDLPWIIHDATNTKEFEMKNLIFALTVWKREILKHKQICIYTDNFAMDKREEKYGERAWQLLSHYMTCEGVSVLNKKDTTVNKFRNIASFATFIKPADDLSRWHIATALHFLQEFYGIDNENIEGTHYRKLPARVMVKYYY